jgi:uncharacterized protein (DUF2267 family)
MATTATGTHEGVHVLDHALQSANEWIREVMEDLHGTDALEALKALRAVMHVLRDRLPTAETLHLSSQLPMLLRGLFLEDFVLMDKPKKYSRDDFLQEIASRLAANNVRKPDPLRFLQAVSRVLDRHVSAGALDKALGCLPEDLRGLWRRLSDRSDEAPARAVGDR